MILSMIRQPSGFVINLPSPRCNVQLNAAVQYMTKMCQVELPKLPRCHVPRGPQTSESPGTPQTPQTQSSGEFGECQNLT